MSESTKEHDIVMIGAGPSALAAAVYTTREDLDTVLIEKGVIGGLAAITDWVDNYPGFEDGVSGLDLAEKLRKQAERFGAVIELNQVESITKEDDDRIRIKTLTDDFLAKVVLIATGTDHRRLGVPGEEEYYGRGVHYCATCDGAFYRDKKLVVVGSGNSAAQESLFLTKFATEIDVLIRGEKWKASDVLIKEIEKNDKITVHFNVESKEIVAEDNKVTKIVGINKKTNEEIEYQTDGVFVFVGLLPNTDFLKESDVELDEFGFVKTNSDLQTSMHGVFASGDVVSGSTMQIASAVGEGATAALKMREFLEDQERSNS